MAHKFLNIEVKFAISVYLSCLLVQISAIKKARDTKFGIEISISCTLLSFILNFVCHVQCARKSIIYAY